MKIHHLFVDQKGESHFEDMEIPYVETGRAGRLSARLPATGISFREVQPDYDLDWHPAPRRQFVVILSGQLEIGLGDGSKHVFGPGDARLVEDTTGQGHTTRVVSQVPVVTATIPLAQQ